MDPAPSIGALPTKIYSELLDEDVAANPKDAAAMKAFTAHRRTLTFGLGALDIIAGATFGLSPFTFALYEEFEYQSRYIGVWVTAVLLCVTSMMFMPVSWAMRSASPRTRKIVFLAIVPLYAGGFLLGALAVKYKQIWLLFLGWALPVGIAQGLENYVGKVLYIQWMGATGHQALGAAFDGAVFAGSTAIFTLINGYVINGIGLSNTYFLWAGVWLAVGLPWIFIAAAGLAVEPPVLARGKPSPTAPPSVLNASRLNAASLESADSAEIGEGEGQQRPLPPVVQTPEPVAAPLSVKALLVSPLFWAVTLVTFIIFFTGFTIQSLIATFFKILFNQPIQVAAAWSAVSLAAIALIRAGIPFMSQWVPALRTMLVTQLLQAVVYAVMPTALANTSSVGVFVVLSVLANAGFAISYSIISLLFIEFFGMQNLSQALSLAFLIGASSAALVGPTIAAYTADSSGGSGAYDTYWYLAAGLSGGSELMLLVLAGVGRYLKPKRLLGGGQSDVSMATLERKPSKPAST